MATSVPVPMAMPRSAAASAGASFTPSPIMATRWPSACRRRTSATLSSGRTSDTTRSASTSAATASAVRRLSPVTTTTSRPMRCRSATAAALVGRTRSATSSTARAGTAPSSPPQPTSTAVWPRASAALVASSISAGTTSNSERRPTRVSTPSIRPRTPRPGRFTKSVTSGRSTSITARTMAAAIGCSDRDSRAAARARASVRSTPGEGATSASSMRASVRVPVLSTTATSTCSARSSTSPPLMITPSWAPRPVPTMMAVGVAKPRAQGQAMMSTATAAVKASLAG